MLAYTFRYDTKIKRKQAIIVMGDKPVAVLETYGIEYRLEGYKRHIERVMRAYTNCMETIRSGEPVKSYNPKKIKDFEFYITDNGASAVLKFRGRIFAQLKMGDISLSMDTALRYIYHVAQSFVKYSGANSPCV